MGRSRRETMREMRTSRPITYVGNDSITRPLHAWQGVGSATSVSGSCSARSGVSCSFRGTRA